MPRRSAGLLVERLESRLTGHVVPDSGLVALMRDTPRMLHHEWMKLCYYLPRAPILLSLHFIPALGQTLVPVLWFLFRAWMLAIQYCDYPFDNYKVPFPAMRAAPSQDRESAVLSAGEPVYPDTGGKSKSGNFAGGGMWRYGDIGRQLSLRPYFIRFLKLMS